MAGSRRPSLTSFLRFSSAASKPTKAATTVRFAFSDGSFLICMDPLFFLLLDLLELFSR